MSNATSLAVVAVVATGEKVPDNYYQRLHILVHCLWMTLPLPGIVTNVINARTFVAVGVEDGVSLSFLALSVSDLCFSLATFLFSCSMLASKLDGLHDLDLPINPMVFIVSFYLMALCTYGISGLSTAYLAIARCMCVVMPLHFRSVFTKTRSVIIHVAFAVFAIGSFGAVYSQMGIEQNFDPGANRTRGVLVFSDIRDDIKDVVFFMFGVAIALPTQILMIVCVIVMTESLRKSQSFRQTAQGAKDDNPKDSATKLSGKELQVVKQVILISIVFIVCSLPKMFTAVYSFVNPEFALGREQSDLYQHSHLLRNGFELINAGSTFLIYYKFNSKFKATLCS